MTKSPFITKVTGVSIAESIASHVGTTFAFGGSTKSLLDCLKIPTGCEEIVPVSNDKSASGLVALANEYFIDQEKDRYEKMDERSAAHQA